MRSRIQEELRIFRFSKIYPAWRHKYGIGWLIALLKILKCKPFKIHVKQILVIILVELPHFPFTLHMYIHGISILTIDINYSNANRIIKIRREIELFIHDS